MKHLIAAGLLVLALVQPAQGQTIVYGDTIVEILGLKNWTPQQLEAAVRSHNPNVTLASAACAVILRDSLGFADAAVLTFSFGGDTVWTAIRVVEPADSALVRFTGHMREDRPLPHRWAALDSALNSDPRLVSYFQHPEFLLDGAESVFGRVVPAEAHEVRRLLGMLSSEEDYDDAVDILRHVRSRGSRQTAALVASNFADRDATWHALVEGFRAGSDNASALAQMMFRALGRSGRFTVDWDAAADALEAVIGGTNLFGYDVLLSGLVDTGVDRDVARRLLRVNPELLVDHATAAPPFIHGPARRFLSHAGAPSGEPGRAELLEWIRGSSVP